VYMVERKLGKGGFGQVYVGRRAVATTAKDGPNANLVRASVGRGCHARMSGACARPIVC
jgi:hypothetical protein